MIATSTAAPVTESATAATESVPHQPVTSLATVARDLAIESRWPAWFTPRSRSARRVMVTDNMEVWLLAWLPGQGTDLHDHGGRSRPCPAAFAVASGTLTHYTVVPGEVPRLQVDTVAEHESATVAETGVHALVNRGDVPAVSVHVYAPRLSMMRKYLFDESGLWLASMIRAGDNW